MTAARFTPIRTLQRHLVMGKPSDCWEWRGCSTHFGYGEAMIGGERIKSHRLAYSVLVGPIPEGACVLHSCDNPRCCNPHHLRLGTLGDNNRDTTHRQRSWQQKKSYCPQGHPYSDGNLIVTREGHRLCRTCRNERARARYRREVDEAHYGIKITADIK